MERMSEKRVTKRVYELVVEGGRNEDDHRMSYIDKVKKKENGSSMELRNEKMNRMDREQ